MEVFMCLKRMDPSHLLKFRGELWFEAVWAGRDLSMDSYFWLLEDTYREEGFAENFQDSS